MMLPQTLLETRGYYADPTVDQLRHEELIVICYCNQLRSLAKLPPKESELCPLEVLIRTLFASQNRNVF